MRKYAIVLLGVIALPAFGANFSGKWAMEGGSAPPGGRRGGPMVLVLNHVGNEVTGTITPRTSMSTGSPNNTEILGGRVEGDVLSFYVWVGNDQPVKMTYRGTISAAQDEIRFTVAGGRGAGMGGAGGQQGGRGDAAEQQVTAKRTK